MITIRLYPFFDYTDVHDATLTRVTYEAVPADSVDAIDVINLLTPVINANHIDLTNPAARNTAVINAVTTQNPTVQLANVTFIVA